MEKERSDRNWAKKYDFINFLLANPDRVGSQKFRKWTFLNEENYGNVFWIPKPLRRVLFAALKDEEKMWGS